MHSRFYGSPPTTSFEISAKGPKRVLGVRHNKRGLVRSASGQSRPNWAVRVMSAFPPIATILQTLVEVRLMPREAAAYLWIAKT
jgi:hypothetical protein